MLGMGFLPAWAESVQLLGNLSIWAVLSGMKMEELLKNRQLAFDALRLDTKSPYLMPGRFMVPALHWQLHLVG